MTTGNFKGKIEAKIIKEKLIQSESSEFIGIYIYKGNLGITIKEAKFIAKNGDYIDIQNEESKLKIVLNPVIPSEIIFTRINKIYS